MAGLSPQQIAAIQSAAQAGITGEQQHQTASQFEGQGIDNSLASSGLFDPSQLNAIAQGWNYGTNGQWGNGPTSAISDFTGQIDSALQGANANQSSIAAMAPSSTSPNAQAIAGTPATATTAATAPYNPLQPAYLSQPATLNATTVQPQYASSAGYNAQTLNPQLTNSLGSGNTVNALVSANQPQFQQQDQQMMQMLATSGMAPSSTAGQTAFNNLSQQQLAGMDPSIAAAIQNSQSNQLNAGQYNTSALNSAGQYNAGNQQNANQYNATTGNTAAQNNANALNTAAGTNVANQNSQQAYNASAYNNAGNNYFNAMTGQYNNNANAFNNINNAGLTGSQTTANTAQAGANNLASGQQSTFPTYSNPYGGISSSQFGSAGAYPSQSSNTSNNYNYGGTAVSDQTGTPTDQSAMGY
jgi:hypothetical protein